MHQLARSRCRKKGEGHGLRTRNLWQDVYRTATLRWADGSKWEVGAKLSLDIALRERHDRKSDTKAGPREGLVNNWHQGLNLAFEKADRCDASSRRESIAPVGRSTCASCNAPIRIALLWHSLSSGNLGIGALTLSNMAIVEAVARGAGLEPHFVVVGMEENETPIPAGRHVESVSVTLRSLLRPSGVWARLRRVDCVIDINAGDSFTDAYGAKRFAILLVTKLMAALLRKPLIFAPQTIGPFRSRLARVLAASALQRSAAIVTRDAASLMLARELAPAVPTVQSIDVSFGMPFDDRSAELGSGRLRIGVNVSGLLYREAQAGTNRFGLSYDYAAFSRALLTRLSALDTIDLYLFCHTTSRKHPADDDSRVADQLAAEFDKVVRVPDFDGPIEAKSFISSLDFVVSARMHACIAALSSGTPVVPVAYSRKFNGLFSALGYDRMLPVTGYTEADAIDFVMAALDDRETLAKHAAMVETEYLLDRYRAVLHEYLIRSVRAARVLDDRGNPGDCSCLHPSAKASEA